MRFVRIPFALLTALFLASCAAPRMPAVDGAEIQIKRSDRSGGAEDLELWWFGSGCHLLKLGGLTVLTDPFVTNGANLLFPKSDPAKVAATFGRMSPPDVVVVNHGHVDHLLDTYPAMTSPGWETVPLWGGRTTCNILAGWKDPDISGRCHEIPADGGRIYQKQTSDGSIGITAYRTKHGPHLDCGFVAFSGNVDQPRHSPPAWQGDYKSGETYNFLITLKRGGTTYRVFYLAGIAGLDEMPGCLPPAGTPIDVAILCTPGHEFVDDYPAAHLKRLRPRHIVLGHFNNFLKNATDEQTSYAGIDFAKTDDMSREVQRFFTTNAAAYPEFEAMHIPSVTVMDGKDRARNVVRIGKP
ncbi:MAG: MBL fold metallo-hydrolase [Akkermansiaceae bacterium]|nr:MBL fold metallo-hydrolase [Akkermansiaceae bacterium]